MKLFPDNSFRLNDCRFGGKLDSVLFSSGLYLIFCLLKCNFDFISVLGL